MTISEGPHYNTRLRARSRYPNTFCVSNVRPWSVFDIFRVAGSGHLAIRHRQASRRCQLGYTATSPPQIYFSNLHGYEITAFFLFSCYLHYSRHISSSTDAPLQHDFYAVGGPHRRDWVHSPRQRCCIRTVPVSCFSPCRRC